MARNRSELQEILSAISGVDEVYFQKPTTPTQKPYIVYAVDGDYADYADNKIYYLKVRYQVTVVDRNPDSTIPSAVRDLPYSRFDRKYVFDGLHHSVYILYF